MGFDLIGKNISEIHTGDSKPLIPVSIMMNGKRYASLEDYLESRGIPRNSIKFSTSNRNWHTIWEYVSFVHFYDEKYKTKCYIADLIAGEDNSGHFISDEKAISIYKSCEATLSTHIFEEYVENRCGVKDPDEKDNIKKMITNFMNFSKKSGGFLIL